MSLAILFLGTFYVLHFVICISSLAEFIFLKHDECRSVHIFVDLEISHRGVGYPSLWPSSSCREPLDVSNEFSFKVIDSILSGNIKVIFMGYVKTTFLCCQIKCLVSLIQQNFVSHMQILARFLNLSSSI
jgi:hypothetical protein